MVAFLIGRLIPEELEDENVLIAGKCAIPAMIPVLDSGAFDSPPNLAVQHACSRSLAKGVFSSIMEFVIIAPPLAPIPLFPTKPPNPARPPSPVLIPATPDRACSTTFLITARAEREPVVRLDDVAEMMDGGGAIPASEREVIAEPARGTEKVDAAPYAEVEEITDDAGVTLRPEGVGVLDGGICVTWRGWTAFRIVSHLENLRPVPGALELLASLSFPSPIEAPRTTIGTVGAVEKVRVGGARGTAGRGGTGGTGGTLEDPTGLSPKRRGIEDFLVGIECTGGRLDVWTDGVLAFDPDVVRARGRPSSGSLPLRKDARLGEGDAYTIGSKSSLALESLRRKNGTKSLLLLVGSGLSESGL